MELKAELYKYVEMEEVPKITIPIESDPQYILVVRFSEVSFFPLKIKRNFLVGNRN